MACESLKNISILAPSHMSYLVSMSHFLDERCPCFETNIISRIIAEAKVRTWLVPDNCVEDPFLYFLLYILWEGLGKVTILLLALRQDTSMKFRLVSCL